MTTSTSKKIVVASVLSIAGAACAVEGSGDVGWIDFGVAGNTTEIWVTAQDDGNTVVLHGDGSPAETISHGFGSSAHFVRFSETGDYAYVSRLGDGYVDVIRASDRQVVFSTLIAPPTEFKGNINPALPGGGGVHDATANADGSVVLATHWGTNRLYKLVGSEMSENWSLETDISINGQRPICSVFNADGTKAYVGLGPSGLAVVDVASMTVTDLHATVGPIPCTQQNARDGVSAFNITITGHFYVLDMTTDTLTDFGDNLGQPHLHGMAFNNSERVLYTSSRETDEIDILDLTGSPIDFVSVDATPGVVDKPDTLFSDGRLFGTLRATGKVVAINNPGFTAPYYWDVTTPLDPDLGYATHGIAVRPHTME